MTSLQALDSSAPHYTWPALDGSIEEAVRRQLTRSLSDRDSRGIIGEFEEAFRDFVGAAYAVSFSSGTGALHALAATQIRPGQKIIAPSYTFFATATPFAYEGIEVVFADADTDGNVSARTLEEAYTEGVAAVIVTHMWGVPCDMDAIVAFCRERSLLLFEDCSHAHFASSGGRRVGLHGDAAVFSTNQKAITSGEGGVLVTSDRNIRDAALLFGHYNKRCFAEVSSTHHDADMSLTGYGLKYRMHTLSAAIGLNQLSKAQEIERRRRENLERIVDATKESPILRVLAPVAPSQHGLYVAGMLYNPDCSSISREEFVARFAAAGGHELDIPGSTTDISGEPLFRRGSPAHPLSTRPQRAFPGTEEFSSLFLKLPLWGYPGDEPYVEAYCRALTELCARATV